MRQLALFDFDGTLTRADTLLEFIRHTHGTFRLQLGLLVLSPVLVAFKVGLVPNWRAKSLLLWLFYGRKSEKQLRQWGETFSFQKVPHLLRAQGRERLRWHVSQGHEVVIVTASADVWLAPWCRRMGVELLATELEYAAEGFTGKLATPNCYGPEKVRRIEAAYALADYGRIFAYGDTRSDKPMLGLADEAFYQPFRR